MAESTSLRWFHFRLRTLLIVVAVVAFPLAWIAKERGESTRDAQIAQQLKSEFEYVTMGQGPTCKISLGGPFDSWESRNAGYGQSGWRQLSRQLLGDRVLEVRISGVLYADAPLHLLSDLHQLQALAVDMQVRQDLKWIENLRSLRVLRLRYEVTAVHQLANLTGLVDLDLQDTGVSNLAPLASLTELRSLRLGGTKISELEPLADLRNLEAIYLDNTIITDLTPLAGLTKLRTVSVVDTLTTQWDVDNLKHELPHCKVVHNLGRK